MIFIVTHVPSFSEWIQTGSFSSFPRHIEHLKKLLFFRNRQSFS